MIVDCPYVTYHWERFEDFIDLSMVVRCCRDVDGRTVRRKRLRIAVRHYM
jgi:hypothetical protein